jgi:hypothetical protein
MIQVDDPEGVALIYQYQNQPLAYAMKTMHMHCGTAMLMVSDGGCLAGDYYAGRDRRTFGRICCKRVQSNGLNWSQGGAEERTHALSHKDRTL